MKTFDAADWKTYLPMPVCEQYPEFTALYERAWELAHNHIKQTEGMPQTPYMDEGFFDGCIWVWDTCFMVQFCKFAQAVFPGWQSLRNFYEVLHDGKTLPLAGPPEECPDWYKRPSGLYEMTVHIADNPPLFAWCEYDNALYSGDTEHLRDLLYNTQYLQRHYEWLENLREPVTLDGVLAPTGWIAEDIGFRWDGVRSGMDNTPRGRTGECAAAPECPNNPAMLWIDAICQQALSARMIAALFRLVGDEQGAAEWTAKFEEKKALVNRYYWDDNDNFYYDIDADTHEPYRVRTVASFWTLTAGVATPERAAALAALVSDPASFGGDVPLLTLAKNDGDYCRDGRYWRGSLWLPTAYAALRGLSDYGYREAAHEAALKIVRHMAETYREYEPHTVWECYAPETCAPATVVAGDAVVRPDFCGWSALGPISLYLEYVLGFHDVNCFTGTVRWEKPQALSGEIGIRNLRFGSVITDIVANGNVCRVTANVPYTLEINGKAFSVQAGEQTFVI